MHRTSASPVRRSQPQPYIAGAGSARGRFGPEAGAPGRMVKAGAAV